MAKIIRSTQVRIRHEVDGNRRALCVSQCGQVVVLRQCVAYVRRRHSARGHLLGLEPDAHGKCAPAKDVGALHTADRRQLRLHYSRQIIRDLVLIEVFGRKADVHRGKPIVRGLQIDDRGLSFRRKIIPYLRYLCLDLREGCIGVVVKLQVHVNRADALGTCGLHVIDPIRAGDDPLERSRDKTANQVSVGAHVHR